MSKEIRLVSRKKRLNIGGIIVLLWFVGLVCYIATSIFVSAHNVTIINNIKAQDNEIARLNESINILSLNVKELSTRERIVSIVKDQGLQSNPDNVISLKNR